MVCMNRRTSEYYDFVVRRVVHLAKTKAQSIIDPRYIITDFEESEIASLKNYFIAAIIIGCWFHFCQAIQRWFQSNKPAHQQSDNLNANLSKCYILLLPWIPVKFVTAFWKSHVIPKIQDVFNKSFSTSLINYINTTWFKRFDIKDWNVYGKPVWTDNPIESNNRKLNEHFGTHTNKIRFTDSLYHYMESTFNDWHKYLINPTHPPQNSRKHNKKKNFLKISRNYWENSKNMTKDPNDPDTMTLVLNYVTELNDIRVQNNKWFLKLNEKKKSENQPLVSVPEFLAKKSLTQIKQDIKICKVCLQKFNNVEFANHTKTCNYKCQECGKIFTRNCKKSYDAHLKCHIQVNSKVGNKNESKVINNNNQKNKHTTINNNSNENSKQFYCHTLSCKKTFKTKKRYNKHIKICKYTKCHLCVTEGRKKIYATAMPSNKILMKYHVAQVHDKNPQFQCDQCNRKFYHKCLLSNHINNTHLGVKSFVCSDCNRKFTSIKSLNQHQIKCICTLRPTS